MTRDTADRKSERPVIGFLGYGSLLSPEEINGMLAGGVDRAHPVTVQGFRRLFNQEASWRKSEDAEQAVLNAVRHDQYELNAVLLSDLSQEEYRELRERESGYRMVEAPSNGLTPYDSADEDQIAAHDLILISTGTKVNSNIRPISEYIDICLDGARAWGEQFYREFIETTEIQAGEPLDDYLETR